MENNDISGRKGPSRRAFLSASAVTAVAAPILARSAPADAATARLATAGAGSALTRRAPHSDLRAMLGEVPVVIVRAGERIHALADRCSHLSGPLSEGDLDDGCLTCPWHGSKFRLADGAVVRGPATAPQPVFDTRVRSGVVQVCLPDAG